MTRAAKQKWHPEGCRNESGGYCGCPVHSPSVARFWCMCVLSFSVVFPVAKKVLHNGLTRYDTALYSMGMGPIQHRMEVIAMNPLDHIMDTAEAAQQWGTTQGYVKKLCSQGNVQARKFGKTWLLSKAQHNPIKKGASKMSGTNYTVTVEPKVGYALRSRSVSEKVAAINIAKKWASEEQASESSNGVYIEFYHPDDGQKGYVNPDGSSLSGKSWTEVIGHGSQV